MEVSTQIMRIDFIKYGILLCLSEVLSSLAIWRGAASDWIGAAPSFWSLEAWRLKYWALFILCAAALWVLAWFSVRRHVPSLAMPMLAVFLAVAAEVLTSALFWRQLPWAQANYLGWSFFPRYFWEHFLVWILTMSAGFALHLFRKRGYTKV